MKFVFTVLLILCFQEQVKNQFLENRFLENQILENQILKNQFWSLFNAIPKTSEHSRQTIYVPPNTERLVSQNASVSELCLTPGCVKAAAEVLSNLDESVDPCNDFYRFACGGWLNRHAFLDDKPSVSVLSEVKDDLKLKLRVLLNKKLDGSEPLFVKMMKEMYETCTDIESIERVGAEPLKKVLKDLGGWPAVEGAKWDESKFDWVDTLISFRNLGYSHDILMKLSVTADYRNDTVHIIELAPTNLGISFRNLVRGLNDFSTAAYFNRMVKAAKLLGANEETVENELHEALQFEIALANFTWPQEILEIFLRNISKVDNKYTVAKLQDLAPQFSWRQEILLRNIRKVDMKYTVAELQDLAPQIQWLKYFNGLLNNKIYENETLYVPFPDFVVKFAALINSTDKRVIANYMMWRVVAQSVSVLSKDWRDIAQEYNTGKSQEKPRWEQCIPSPELGLEIAFSSYYVRHYFKEESKDAALELVKYIHSEFLNILEDIDWMDEVTKKEAKAKANTIKFYIGYPKELLNDTAVQGHYENLTITNRSFFESSFGLRKWSTDYAFSQLRKPNIKGEWKKHARATEDQAFNTPMENSIEIPAGILQNAFFNKDRPHYMNFGAIGYIIGHEITRVFGDIDELFKTKAQCIIDQYGNYTAENGMQVNGVSTLKENIADNGGLKEAYRAYQSWVKVNGQEHLLPGIKYSQNQMFWISAANVRCGKYRPEELKRIIISGSHSPPQFRVIGPMSNLAEFAKDFECPPSSPMNKEHKCEVW